MVSEENVANFLSKHFGEYDSKGGGEYLFYSPFVEHRKKKLQVNLDPEAEEFGWFQCWVSKKSGKSLFTLLKKAGKPKSAFRGLDNLLDKDSFSLDYTKDEDQEEEAEQIELPDEFVPLWKSRDNPFYKRALKYVLSERNMTLADIARYKIGCCFTGRYSDRIIVPSYSEDGDLNYFVARDYTGYSDLKYLNPKAPKNTVVFGSRITWTQPVTLVEGIFDAIAARRNAIPLLGQKPSEILRRKLYFERPPKVYIALDRDALSNAAELAEELQDEGLDVHVLEMKEGADPADMGFRRFQEVLRNAKPLSFRRLVSIRLQE